MQSMIKNFTPMMDGFNTGLKDNVKRLFFGFSKENKYFVGYFYENQLIAILDYLIGYPNSNTIFIGLFMVDASFQRKGMGRFIIKEFIQYYSSYSIQLAWLTNNIPAEKFWANLGLSLLNKQKAKMVRKSS